MRTVTFVGATRAIFSRSSRIAELRPVISEEPSRRNTSSRSLPFSRKSRVCSTARPADASRTSGANGLVMKSKEPRRMLSTASSMVANAVRKTTDKAESASCAEARTSNPSPSPIFWSVMTASKRNSARARRASLTLAASTISWPSCFRLEARIRRMCGSSSTISICPSSLPIHVRLVRRLCGNFDREAYQSWLVDPEHDVAAMRTRDIAGDSQAEAVPSLLGCK